MSMQSIEWAPFKLRPGVAEMALIEASNRMQAGFLDKQAGFLRRELLKVNAGNFVDLVWWDSRDAADAAIRQAGESQACGQYFALMQFDAQAAGETEACSGVTHLSPVASYKSK